MRLLLGLVLAVLAALMCAPAASAAPTVAMGPGTGFLTLGALDRTTACTIGAVGYDSEGRLVALTAGHCILAPGLPVTLVSAPFAGPVGTTASGHWGPDYGVIVLDPARVFPVASTGGVTVTAVGDVAPGTPVCKSGQLTGTTCGSVSSVAPTEIVSDAVTGWGDSGGPLVVGTTLVGLVSRPTGTPFLSPTGFAPITAALAALDARGGPGAGFRVFGS